MAVKDRNDYWSYSLYNCWKGCKRAYKYRKIDKIKVPGTYALNQGTSVHKMAEGYLKGSIRGVPKVLKHFEKDFKMLKSVGAESEIDLTIDKDMQPSKGNDFQNAWCRGSADIGHVPDPKTIKLIDLKTGKDYPEHEEQEDLYGVLAFCHYEVEVIQAECWYVNTGEKNHAKTYTITDYRKLKKVWLARAEKMRTTKRFPKTKDGWRCGWCSYNKKNGGPCDGV